MSAVSASPAALGSVRDPVRALQHALYRAAKAEPGRRFHALGDKVHGRPPGRGGPPQFPLSPSQRSMPHTPGSPSRLHLQDLRRFHGLRPDFGGSALPAPVQRDGPLTTPQASLHATDRCFAPPLKGFRHWASTPGVSPQRRQSATGPPGSYPDRTPTGRRQPAYDQRSLTTSRPPVCWAHERSRLTGP